MKKIFIVLIVLFLISFGLTGCKNHEKENEIIVTTSLYGKPVLVGNEPSNFPLVNSIYKLNILVAGYDDVDQNDLYVWKKYEQMTGIDSEFTTVIRAERDAVVNNTLTSANSASYDLIMRCKIPAIDLAYYGENGMIYDLAKDDMLKNMLLTAGTILYLIMTH